MTVGTKSSPDEEEADMSYHTDQFYRWHMDQLDPSISLVSQYSFSYSQSYDKSIMYFEINVKVYRNL